MANQDEYPSTFESVLTDNNYEVLRLKVPGGWMVLIRDSENSQTLSEFIDDKQHHWDVV